MHDSTSLCINSAGLMNPLYKGKRIITPYTKTCSAELSRHHSPNRNNHSPIARKFTAALDLSPISLKFKVQT
jgi:hypothetical protein